MSLMHTAPKNAIVTWDCSCGPRAAGIPISQDFCPHCGASMPQEARTKIYLQVLGEFREENRRYARIRRRRFLLNLRIVITKIWPFLLLLAVLFVAVSGVGWVIRQLPAVFSAIREFFVDVFDGPVEFIQDLFPEKTKEPAAVLPQEKDPFTFQKLLQAVKNFFGWIKDALVWVWDALGWIFGLLKKLWKAFVWLLKFVAGLAVVACALIIELVKLLFKVIKFLFSLF